MRCYFVCLLTAATFVGCSKSSTDSSPPAAKPAAGSHAEHGGAAGHDHGAMSGGEHGGHGAKAAHGDHASDPGKIVVQNDAADFQAGEEARLRFTLQHGDKVVTEFDLLHTKKVHFIAVREGLDQFMHLHPEVGSDGELTTAITFPVAGRYWLFADHQPQGGSPATARGEIVVAGDAPPAEKLTANVPGRVTGNGLQAEIAVDSSGGASETSITFALLDDAGAPVSDLQTYLGAMGHLVILSADGRDYVHAHNDAKSAPDGRVTFEAHFPKPGNYKGWGQFRRGEVVSTVPFVIEVK